MLAANRFREFAMAAFERITLWLGGLGFLGFGTAFLVDPLGVFALTGVALQGSVAAVELRAFYGGLEVGLGLFLLGADLAGARRAGLLLVLASYGGIALARLLGIALASGGSGFLWAALAVEATLALLALVALAGHRRGGSARSRRRPPVVDGKLENFR
jgi:hypothetical protein